MESCRLQTAIRDNGQHFTKVLAQLRELSDPIYGTVEDFIVLHRRIDSQILRRILQIQALDGYSGNPNPGQRFGSPPPAADSSSIDADIEMGDLPTPRVLEDSNGIPDEPMEDHDDGDDNIENEEVQGDIGGLIQFFEGLGL